MQNNFYSLKTSLVDTLGYLLIHEDSNVENNDKILVQLNELEGDVHTFMHPDNLSIIEKQGLLSKDLVSEVIKLRREIQAIPSSMWNPEDFRLNPRWQELRVTAMNLIDQVNG